MTPRRTAGLIAAIALLAAPASAADFRPRRMGIVWTPRHATVTFGFRDLFTRGVRTKAVESGLPTTIVATLAAHHAQDEERIVGVTVRTCEITWDLWDEVFVVKLEDRGVPATRRVVTFTEVEGLCARLRGVPVARRAAFRPGRDYRISARLDVNPLSQESVRRIKRWLNDPDPGSGAESGIFGSVSSLFANPQVARAERTLRLRSQAFRLP